MASENSVYNINASFEDKNEVIWRDLDDNMFDNHFINGQCGVGVTFNTGTNSGGFDKWHTLPIYPDDINFSGSTNYNSAEILGRPGQISGYVSTGDVTSRINLNLHRELQVPNEPATDRNKIDEILAFIQACNWPKRISNGILTPIVTYVFGDTIICGKQTSFNSKWDGPKIGNAYMHVNIDISITHVPNGIIYYDDVKGFNPRKFE